MIAHIEVEAAVVVPVARQAFSCRPSAAGVHRLNQRRGGVARGIQPRIRPQARSQGS